MIVIFANLFLALIESATFTAATPPPIITTSISFAIEFSDTSTSTNSKSSCPTPQTGQVAGFLSKSNNSSHTVHLHFFTNISFTS